MLRRFWRTVTFSHDESCQDDEASGLLWIILAPFDDFPGAYLEENLILDI